MFTTSSHDRVQVSNIAGMEVAVLPLEVLWRLRDVFFSLLWSLALQLASSWYVPFEIRKEMVTTKELVLRRSISLRKVREFFLKSQCCLSPWMRYDGSSFISLGKWPVFYLWGKILANGECTSILNLLLLQGRSNYHLDGGPMTSCLKFSRTSPKRSKIVANDILLFQLVVDCLKDVGATCLISTKVAVILQLWCVMFVATLRYWEKFVLQTISCKGLKEVLWMSALLLLSSRK